MTSSIALRYVAAMIGLIFAAAWAVQSIAAQKTRITSAQFALANVLLAIGIVLASLRSTEPSYVAFHIADASIMTGIAMIYLGTARSAGMHAKIGELAPLFLGIGLLGLLPPDPSSYIPRVVLFATLFSWYAFKSYRAANTALLGEALTPLHRFIVTWPFLLASVFYCFRMVSILAQTLQGHQFSVQDELKVDQMMFLMIALIVFINISLKSVEVGKLINRLRAQADRDYLTGAWNRRSMDQRFELEIARNARKPGSLSCVLFDIDHFKRINDTYGHAVGDMAIKAVVSTAQRMIRSIDSLGRIGGEEFLILIPQTSLEGAVECAERIRMAIHDTRFEHNGVAISLSASFGVASLRGDEARESLLQRVDEALYRAKNNGRDRTESAHA